MIKIYHQLEEHDLVKGLIVASKWGFPLISHDISHNLCEI
jgi:hypothetical protein